MIRTSIKFVSSVTFLALSLAAMTVAAGTLAIRLVATTADAGGLVARLAAHAVPDTREARLRAEVAKLEAEVSTLKTRLAAAAREKQRDIARLRAKSRLKRTIIAVPVVGLGVAAYFEKQEMDEWLSENPGRTEADYACEVGRSSAEVIDEVLQAVPESVIEWLPAAIIPGEDATKKLFSDCSAATWDE